MPRKDRAYRAVERFGFRYVPFFQKAYRTGIYWGRECFVPGFIVNPKLAAPAKKLALKNIEDGISDPELRAAVTPDYQIGCKRILISNDYYPALDCRPRRPGHRRDRADHADRHRHDGRHRPRGGRHRGGDRLLHDRAADRPAHQGPRRSHAGRRVARAAG